MKSISQIIAEIQSGNPESKDCLYNRFYKLILKMSRSMEYEEAESDIKIAFLELIDKIDLSKFKDKNDNVLASYINISLEHKRASLLRSVAKEQDMLPYDDNILSICEDNYNGIELDNLLSSLTPMQKKIITGKFIDGYTDAELCSMLGVTRKTIYNNKKRALAILRDKEFKEK